MKSLVEFITEAKNSGEKLAKALIDHVSKLDIKKNKVGGKFAKMPSFKQTSESIDLCSQFWEVVKNNSRGFKTTANDVSQMVIDKANKTVIELDGTGDITICNPSLDQGFTLLGRPETDKDDEKSYVVWTKVNAENLKNHSDHTNRHKKFYAIEGEWYEEIKNSFKIK